MAENLSKSKLILDEKKGKKKLYKSWKLYAITLGIIGAGLGIGLGVGLGVNANNVEINITDQDITNAIKKINYSTVTLKDTSVETINDEIDANFIRRKLTGSITDAFKNEKFKLNKITVGEDNHQLVATDLEKLRTLDATINFDYDTISNQETKLVITIITNPQEIVDTINTATYNLSATLNDKTTAITNQLTGAFIKAQLNAEIADQFDDKAFKFNQVTINGHNLQASDLTTKGTINAKINYDYDTISNQEANLIITINITDQQVIDAINSNKYYWIQGPKNSTATSITSRITGDFIKAGLSDEFGKIFNTEAFTFNKITVGEDNHELNDSDLTKVETIDAYINYNYKSIRNQNVHLDIVIKISYEQISDAINKTTTYNLAATVDDTAASITNKITSSFIANQLNGEIADWFIPDLFEFDSITVGTNNNILVDTDLTSAQIINAKINFRYGSAKDQNTNLTIKVTNSDQQIVEEINNSNYSLIVKNDTNAQKIKDQINPNFIAQQLGGNFKQSFNDNLFTLNQITIDTDNHILRDSDLVNDEIINTKINYNYGSISNAVTKLTIRLNSEILEQDIINTIKNITYSIQITKGTAVSTITNQLTGAFIKAQLNDDIANQFDDKAFKFNQVTINANDLQDSDLATNGIINAKISLNYNTNIFETNMTIIIE